MFWSVMQAPALEWCTCHIEKRTFCGVIWICNIFSSYLIMKVINIFLFCIAEPAKKAAPKIGKNVLPVRSWIIFLKPKVIGISFISCTEGMSLGNELFDNKIIAMSIWHQTNTWDSELSNKNLLTSSFHFEAFDYKLLQEIFFLKKKTLFNRKVNSSQFSLDPQTQ